MSKRWYGRTERRCNQAGDCSRPHWSRGERAPWREQSQHLRMDQGSELAIGFLDRINFKV